jgi:hypothetical protein
VRVEGDVPRVGEEAGHADVVEMSVRKHYRLGPRPEAPVGRPADIVPRALQAGVDENPGSARLPERVHVDENDPEARQPWDHGLEHQVLLADVPYPRLWYTRSRQSKPPPVGAGRKGPLADGRWEPSNGTRLQLLGNRAPVFDAPRDRR